MESKSVPARCSDAMPETGRADREKRCEAVSGETKSRKKVRIEHRIECDEDRSKDGACRCHHLTQVWVGPSKK
jgi:hypothetical protein